MKFVQANITKAANGYIVQTTIIDPLHKTQDQEVNVFDKFEQVIAYLYPSKIKLDVVK